MTSYEIYTLALCIVVYIMLATLSVTCVTAITKMSLRLTRAGLNDARIIDEYVKSKKHEELNKLAKFLNSALSFIICLAFLAVFVSSFFVENPSNTFKFTEESAYRVVQTDSMEHKNKKNKYLFENNLNDQIQTFDIIKTAPLPDEMELELYDIVVYELDGILIVHRIVGIEEPNDYHPNCRYFKLQGDAIDSADRFPVLYSQMKAIYKGERIPFVGSFVLFMQSPAGWLCTILVLIAMIATPILEEKFKDAKAERLAIYGIYPDEDEDDDNLL